jgi:hypothetical protein
VVVPPAKSDARSWRMPYSHPGKPVITLSSLISWGARLVAQRGRNGVSCSDCSLDCSSSKTTANSVSAFAWRLPTMQPILACLVVASASAFVAHAPRCVTSQAPRSASAKAVLSGLPDADEPLDFRKEINELKVITEGLAKNFTMLEQYFRDEISDLKPVTVVSTSRLLSLGTQETKAETETEQDPLAISAKDDTFPVCCSPLRPPPLRRARLSRRGVHHPDQSLPRLPLQS